MKLQAIVQSLGLQNHTPDLSDRYGVEITKGFASDLLSDVLANAAPGSVVITVQAHMNTIAVALHARLAAVILAAGRVPEQAVIDRALDEGVPLFTSALPTFEIAGKLYELGLRG